MDLGEIEARSATERLGLMAEERRNSLPVQVKKEDVIITRPPTAGDDRTMYSIEMLPDGQKMVVIDNDILKNVPKDKVKATVKNHIRNAYKNGVLSLDGKYKTSIDKQGANEFVYSDYTNGLKPNEKIDKFRMAGNLDEIIQSQQNSKLENTGHSRKDNIVSFYRSDVKVKVGNRVYDCELITALTTDGSEKFYDVVNLNAETKNESRPIRSGKSHLSGRRGALSSNNSIPSKDGTVNASIRKIGGEHAVESVKKKLREGAQAAGRRPVSLPQPANEQERMLQRYWAGDETDYITPASEEDPYVKYRDDTLLQEHENEDVDKYTQLRYNEDGTIVVTDDWKERNHVRIPAKYKPNAVVDIRTSNKEVNRTIYDENARQKTRIHPSGHGNLKRHPYGNNGEHAHDVIWKNGKIVGKTDRELTISERKEHDDIL